MRRILSLLLAVLLLLSTPVALAHESFPTPFGGTKEWPEFRGLQPGLSLQAVALREESRGTQLDILGYEGTSLGDLPEKRGMKYSLVASDVSMYGKDVTILYDTASYCWNRASFYAAFNTKEEARLYYDTVAQDLLALYGVPDERTYSVANESGGYDDLPVDPQDEYYTLWDEMPDIPADTVADLEWHIGYRYNQNAVETASEAEGFGGRLLLYLRTPDRVEESAALGVPANCYLVTCFLASSYQVGDPQQALYYDERAYD